MLDIGRALRRPVKVDDITLKRKIGYYASVLVEVDLSKAIPEKVLVKTKYGGFSQRVQMPNAPKFCNHCKVIGHYVAECRLQRKESTQKECDVAPKTVNRYRRNNKSKEDTEIPIGFDICDFSNNKSPDTDVVNENVSTPKTLPLKEAKEEGEVTSERFEALKDTEEFSLFSEHDFPQIEVVKMLEIGTTSATQIVKVTPTVESKKANLEIPKVISTQPTKSVSLITIRKQAGKILGKKSSTLQPPIF